MQPRYQVTKAAIELVKRFEGFRSRAAKLPDGRWTIGYGHTRTAREGAEISEADADALLIYDLSAVITALNEWVFTPLSQNQFDALAAFAFNIGLPNFRRSSVLRRLNEGSHLQAACAMEMWRVADFEGERIVMDALVRRRSAEMALYLTPMDGHVPVPSLIVMPRVDEGVARSAPIASAPVEAPLEGAVAQVYRTDDPMPSAGQAAAAAVSARLNALLQDVPEPETAAAPLVVVVEDTPLEAQDAAAEPQVAADPAQDEEPVLDLSAMIAQAQAHVASETELQAAVQADIDMEEEGPFAPRPIAFSMPRGVTPSKKTRDRAPGPVLALVGIIGLMVFAAGIFWGFNARASVRFPILPDPLMTGWLMGLVGVGLAASSIYLLLKRMGARGD